MPPFQRKIPAEMIDPIYEAHAARGITYERIAEMVAAGDFGPAVKIAPSYVGKLVRRERLRRAGKLDSQLGDMAPADSNDYMRRAALNFFHAEERRLNAIKPEKRDLNRVMQLVKLGNVIAAMPGPKDPRPRNPGSHTAGVPDPPKPPQSGPGGDLLKAFRERVQNDERPAQGGALEDGQAA